MMTVYLSALGIACTLGRGKQAVSNALFEKCNSPTNGEWTLGEWTLLSQKKVPVGKISFELPQLPEELKAFDSRNNRLLKIVLDEIKEDLDAAIARYGSSRVGIVLATSTSGMLEEESAFCHNFQTNLDPQDYHYSQSEISSPSLFASRYLGVEGPSYTISTACSSSGKAICSAKRLLAAGICDAVVVGGVDTLCALTLNGFDSLELISSKPCNPFSKNREGITIGEGAAVFLALREGSFADIELSGCGESSDAHHICSPDPEGLGAQAAIQNALSAARVKPEDICYINLHGTGTALNDSMESITINRIFGKNTPCSSTKSLTGHTLGAAGAIEAGLLWLALSSEDNEKIPLPHHHWDGEPDPAHPQLALTGYGEFVSPVNEAYSLMSNSFAFGGSNVSLILKKKPLANWNIVELLPHDRPMVLIDRVLAFQDDYIHCQTIISDHSPFCENSSVPSYVGIEYMAQTVSIWNSLVSKCQHKEPKIGFLLGARSLKLNTPDFKIGDVLDIYCKNQYTDGEMAAFECSIELNGKEAARAGLNVYQPKEAHE